MKIADYASIFLQETPLIDVRAPVEFDLGSLPGSVNFPILNDEERTLVGTAYKEKGPEQAVLLGHQLVSGSVKAKRIEDWLQFVQNRPETVLYCFRGGQRSQITQQWLREAGIHRPLIQGGYKAVRQFFIEEIDRLSQMGQWLVISGATGSGKTVFLQSFQSELPNLDLEDLAKHRGSAFGAMDIPQPTQINFENLLAVQFLKAEKAMQSGLVFIIEDESRMIGSRHLPESLFNRMRESQVIWIDDPLEVRVERILQEYVEKPLQKTAQPELVFQKFTKAIQAIHRKLGGVRTQELLQNISDSQNSFLLKQDLAVNREWIGKLLSFYYDPLYFKSLDRRQVKLAFRGPFSAAQEFLWGSKSSRF